MNHVPQSKGLCRSGITGRRFEDIILISRCVASDHDVYALKRRDMNSTVIDCLVFLVL